MTEWVCGEFMFTCLTAVTRAATLSAFTQRRLFAHGDAASNTNRDANMSTIHTTLPPLLREWAKAKLTVVRGKMPCSLQLGSQYPESKSYVNISKRSTA
ncbi:hypothetical protein L210DRAFT_2428836 [Boletus edulis BED1]|uniref:Secreted protein n=1 Tax=Boletus edulis BED1 TaxID=1328754 RepID=A0AAD4C8Y7_BOLED|nr:hypothetical protein L210DRAFT_2428836 [Boletus edulis BED1]